MALHPLLSFGLHMLGLLLATAVVTAICSFMGAISLRFCRKVLGFSAIDYWESLRIASVCNMTFALMQYGFSVVYIMSVSAKTRSWDYINVSMSYALYATAFSVLIFAAVLRRMSRPEADGNRIAFWDALALSGLYHAFSIGTVTLVILMVSFTLGGFLTIVNLSN
ncbi:MAG: hypothetical protein AAF483_22195 [Planctomycetota bacterium]